jgi:hypothetical protein
MASAAALARRLARDAEAVCRHYLSHGRRSGRYWLCGDVMNTPGRSLYVRLSGPDHGPGAAGRWTDGATLEYGDLLDLIALNRGSGTLGEAMAEARAFLALPHRPEPAGRSPPVPRGSPPAFAGAGSAARRLFRAAHPISGTLAEAYLRARGLTGRLDWPALRYHPAAWYRENPDAPRRSWPALLAAVTDPAGAITGVLRTWLDPLLPAKAPIADPRRALGHLLGNGVRFGTAEPAPAKADVLAAGEGIETVLALKSVLPSLPMVAGLSANHLAALAFPPALRRLYVARDNDAAGRRATERLRERGEAAGIEVRDLAPVHGDFNLDLCRLGPAAMLGHLAAQLAPADRVRFLSRDPIANAGGAA